MLKLFYDTETQGFPIWKEPSSHPDQPHIVQLAGKLVDTETRRVIQSIDLITKPDKWVIPDAVAEIHGITTEYASDVGINESVAVDALLELANSANMRVAHNEPFDMRIMRIALMRFYDELAADAWKTAPAECTMRMATPICNLPNGTRKTPKWPKLAEAYEFLLGRPMDDAHSAMGDVNACIEVYFAMQDRQQQVDAIGFDA